MYGGRAIDDFDRRVLTTYMEEYFGDFIFDPFQPFHFYHNPGLILLAFAATLKFGARGVAIGRKSVA